MKALYAVNGTTWHDTFLGLWVSALRLVQRVNLIQLLKIFLQSLIVWRGNKMLVIYIIISGGGNQEFFC